MAWPKNTWAFGDFPDENDLNAIANAFRTWGGEADAASNNLDNLNIARSKIIGIGPSYVGFSGGTGAPVPAYSLDIVAQTGSQTAARVKGNIGAGNDNTQLRFASGSSGTEMWAIGNIVGGAGQSFQVFDLVSGLARFVVNGSGGGLLLSTPNSQVIIDASIPASMAEPWVDETNNLLKFRVRYSTGVYKTGTISLA